MTAHHYEKNVGLVILKYLCKTEQCLHGESGGVPRPAPKVHIAIMRKLGQSTPIFVNSTTREIDTLPRDDTSPTGNRMLITLWRAVAPNHRSIQRRRSSRNRGN
jgi:hypothetical protein